MQHSNKFVKEILIRSLILLETYVHAYMELSKTWSKYESLEPGLRHTQVTERALSAGFQKDTEWAGLRRW